MVGKDRMPLSGNRLDAEMFDCEYESLAAAPEQKIRGLMDFVALDWNDR